MNRFYAVFGAFGMMITVMLGAFGAHGLRHLVSPDRLVIWHTSVLYSFIHCMGLLLLSALSSQLNPCKYRWAARLMMIGTLIFSGSLYILVLADMPRIGMITPVGGVCFVLSWLMFGLAILRK